MARLTLITQGLGANAIELRLGVNRVGRDPKSDIFLNHPTVSARHCELVLSADGVALHDCGSTNGTSVNGRPVSETWLQEGQVLHIGEVALQVESVCAKIGIPHMAPPEPSPPPVILPDGGMLCPRHPEHQAIFQCTRCREIMCGACVRIVRIRGGAPHYLCATCHNPSERIVGDRGRRKRGFLAFLQETVRFRLNSPRKDR